MNNFRRKVAWDKRQEANELANQRPHPRHVSNGDELKFRHTKKTEACHKESTHDYKYDKNVTYKEYCEKLEIKGKPSYLMSFTKGMPHDHETGLLKNPDHYPYFVKAIDSGDPRDFRDTPLGAIDNIGSTDNLKPLNWKSLKAKKGGKDGGKVGIRAWESQSAGLACELEGPDAQAVTMPPAPKLGSAELVGEMSEIYAQALLRDTPFTSLSVGGTGFNTQHDTKKISEVYCLKAFHIDEGDFAKVFDFTRMLNHLSWFDENESIDKLTASEAARRCGRICPTPATAFRGITTGDDIGPYLSQFLLVGNTGINRNDDERATKDGLITYGAISTDQRVRTAVKGKDYMTTWEEWLDVQHGADVSQLEDYVSTSNANARRFIHTPRDLATYVHYDALYEAYLNACLILLGLGTPFDPGIPFQEPNNRDHQQGFAHFGGPHILSLVTEVATRALKAVRFQKYNIHRRCRPEVLAARVHKQEDLKHMAPEIKEMYSHLFHCGILPEVAAKNGKDNYLLPMAFCEGSPMHPAYGAGHATVAGACVTILKAFFDHGQHLEVVPTTEITSDSLKVFKSAKKGILKSDIHSSNLAYVSVNHGKELKAVPVLNVRNEIDHLTVEGELNKLASNISIGRNWAGVHYFSDYYESLLMGEQIAIGILEEQKIMFGENFHMTVPKFDGTSIRI